MQGMSGNSSLYKEIIFKDTCEYPGMIPGFLSEGSGGAVGMVGARCPVRGWAQLPHRGALPLGAGCNLVREPHVADARSTPQADPHRGQQRGHGGDLNLQGAPSTEASLLAG